MARKLIDQNEFYRFDRISLRPDEALRYFVGQRVSTTYVHKGEGILHMGIAQRDIPIIQGQGFVVVPGDNYTFFPNGEVVAYSVTSRVRHDSPLIEIVDHGTHKDEIPLTESKVVVEPKMVVKPWGHELWIGYNNRHVLKQIKKVAGSQSSLHFHHEKVETNYIESGEAEVIEGNRLDPFITDEQIRGLTEAEFDKFRKRIPVGGSWTSMPMEGHRVIAITEYIAYEASTPQLDDVIRIKDDSGRGSGKIVQEHLGGKDERR